MEISDSQQWDAFINGSQYGHPLQLWGWGEAKSGNGWTAHRIAMVGRDSWIAAAQVLIWQMPRTGRVIAYVPRGPVVDPKSETCRMFLRELTAWAKARRAICLRLEPSWSSVELEKGWVRSRSHVQMSETYVIDLGTSEEDLQSAMSRKHRQYIRQAARNGVNVRRAGATDLNRVYEIYSHTASRAQFALHARGYYEKVFQVMGQATDLYIASLDKEDVAFLWLAHGGETAYELYGGMTEQGGLSHANYALKWRAILDAKEAGLTIYDFNGRVTAGVSTFKAGFGPREVDYIGTMDYPINRVAYRAWERLWPLAKPLGRLVRRRAQNNE